MFLDTTFCIDLIRENRAGGGGSATAKLYSLGNTPLHVSVFVVCELHTGARLSRNPDAELRKVELLVDQLNVVYPDVTFPVAYAELEVYLRSRGTPIPTMDLLIGAMAHGQGLPLLTRDTEHYSVIPELVLESY